MKTTLTLVFGMLLLAANVRADSFKSLSNAIGDRDPAYEALLRAQAAPQEPLTPRKAIRWLRGLANTPDTLRTEFQPVVKVQDGGYQVVAAVAYKF